MASTSATSFCPIDDEELDLSNDELFEDELDIGTEGIRCAGSRGTSSHGCGGRPPISGKKD
jgi:hypothetical protein